MVLWPRRLTSGYESVHHQPLSGSLDTDDRRRLPLLAIRRIANHKKASTQWSGFLTLEPRPNCTVVPYPDLMTLTPTLAGESGSLGTDDRLITCPRWKGSRLIRCQSLTIWRYMVHWPQNAADLRGWVEKGFVARGGSKVRRMPWVTVMTGADADRSPIESSAARVSSTSILANKTVELGPYLDCARVSRDTRQYRGEVLCSFSMRFEDAGI